jgi:hypothetical protein
MGRKVVFILLLICSVVVGYKNRVALLDIEVPFFGKKKSSFEERAARFYAYYDEMCQVAERKVVVNKLELAESQPFDFSKTLLLLDEVSNIIKRGPLLDVTKNPVRRHLVWLKRELESEEASFFDFLAVQRRGKTEQVNLRTRRSMQFYLRAIKNSIDKLEKSLAKVKIKD